MRRPKSDVFQVLQARPKIVGVRVGSIVAVRPRGKVLVDFPGNPFGPVVARQTPAAGGPMHVVDQPRANNRRSW